MSSYLDLTEYSMYKKETNSQNMYNDDMSLLYDSFDSYWYNTILERFLETKFEKLIENKKIIFYENHHDTDFCSICLDTFKITEPNIKTIQLNKCKHIFHSKCLQKWIDYNDNCPLCRTLII